jgi:hypothetical protein
MGNIHGRFEPDNSMKEALLIGSHMVRPFFFYYGISSVLI